MTALARVNVATTKLSDLPGNKMSKGSNPASANQPFQFRKCLKLNVKRSMPSDHFIKASDKESSSEEENSSCEEESSTEDEETSRSKTLSDLRRSSQQVEFKPINLASGDKIFSRRVPLILSNSNTSPLSKNQLANSPERIKGVGGIEKTPPILKLHCYSETKERCLLDALVEIDEDEEWRLNDIQTDDDLYLMWKCGESRKPNKNSQDVSLSKRSAKQSSIRGAGANQLSRKDSKIDLFSAWQTVYNKKPIQKLKDERKQRLNQPSYNQLYVSKHQTYHDKLSDSSPYTFFHYTDIALYIQQYRSNHACGNPCAKHPGYCPEHLPLQDLSDVNFPFKFDFNTDSVRNKLASRGCNLKGSETEAQRARHRGPEEQGGNGSISGYLSPVSFRTPHSFKIHTAEKWNSLPESPSRLRHQLKKIWHSYERKDSTGGGTGKTTLATPEEGLLKDGQRTLSSMVDDATIKSISNRNSPNNVITDSHSSGANDDVRHNVRNEEQARRSPMFVRIRETKLDRSIPPSGGDTMSSPAENQVPDHVGIITNDAGDVRSNDDIEKNERMKSLIASEIINIQKKQIITIEQKRKLDKFKEALSVMSGGTDQSDSHSNKATPGGSDSKHLIAGSVRAYYTRTATSGSLIETVHTQTISCDDLELEGKQDDRPIIYVTQPHLRHVTRKQRRPEQPVMAKKLIGGRLVERKQRHPADTKQFTRITDLLRIKERKQSAGRAFRGSQAKKHKSPGPKHSNNNNSSLGKSPDSSNRKTIE